MPSRREMIARPRGRARGEVPPPDYTKRSPALARIARSVPRGEIGIPRCQFGGSRSSEHGVALSQRETGAGRLANHFFAPTSLTEGLPARISTPAASFPDDTRKAPCAPLPRLT